MDTRPPHPLHAAIGLFTVVPVPPMPVDRATAQRAILALPWVGLLVGLAAATASVVVDAVGHGQRHQAGRGGPADASDRRVAQQQAALLGLDREEVAGALDRDPCAHVRRLALRRH